MIPRPPPSTLTPHLHVQAENHHVKKIVQELRFEGQLTVYMNGQVIGTTKSLSLFSPLLPLVHEEPGVAEIFGRPG